MHLIKRVLSFRMVKLSQKAFPIEGDSYQMILTKIKNIVAILESNHIFKSEQYI